MYTSVYDECPGSAATMRNRGTPGAVAGGRPPTARAARVRAHHRARPGRRVRHEPGQHRLPLRLESGATEHGHRVGVRGLDRPARRAGDGLSLIHISEPTRRTPISYA